jgi:hypothetical protein
MVVEDMTRSPPEVVFVETGYGRLGLGNQQSDDIAFYAKDTNFAKLWRRYHEVHPVGPLRVFVRNR